MCFIMFIPFLSESAGQTIESRTKDQKRPPTQDGLDSERGAGDNEQKRSSDEPADFYLGDLFAQLSAVVAAKPAERLTVNEGINHIIIKHFISVNKLDLKVLGLIRKWIL